MEGFLQQRLIERGQATGAAIRARTAVLDREGICLSEGRRSQRLRRTRPADQPAKDLHGYVANPATFIAIEVLATDGDHTSEPLSELIDPRAELITSMAVEGQWMALFETTRARKMEGIVVKREGSRYQFDTRLDN